MLFRSGRRRRHWSPEGSSSPSSLYCTSAVASPPPGAGVHGKFGTKVGYSDHTVGFEAAVAAVVLGANVIEKHFTLNHNMEEPNHKASLEPEEFEIMVNNIRLIEKALGDGVKQPAEAEKKNIAIARKNIEIGRAHV